MTKSQCEKFEVFRLAFPNAKPLSLHKDSKTKNHKYSIFRDEPAFPKAVIQSSICQLTNHDCDDGPVAELETGRLPIAGLCHVPPLRVHNQPNRKAPTAFTKLPSTISHLHYNRHGELVTGAAETSYIKTSVQSTIYHVAK